LRKEYSARGGLVRACAPLGMGLGELGYCPLTIDATKMGKTRCIGFGVGVS
jgi:hypothetical protein